MYIFVYIPSCSHGFPLTFLLSLHFTIFYDSGGYGILALGIADTRAKFISFCAGWTGSTHDSMAWSSSQLYEKLDAGLLPAEYFLIGDEAFSTTEYLLSPWPGRGLGRWKDSFNYHLSAERQCIERAFGIFVKRWGILQRKFIFEYDKWPLVTTVLAKLHNLCIDQNVDIAARWPDDIRPGDLPEVHLNDYEEANADHRDHAVGQRRRQITKWLEDRGIGRAVHSNNSRA